MMSSSFSPRLALLFPEKKEVCYQTVHRKRLAGLFAIVAFCFLMIAGRIVSLSFLGHCPYFFSHVLKKPLAFFVEKKRCDILDRNQTLIATSVPTSSLYANPQKILDSQEACRFLSDLFPEKCLALLQKKLACDKQFVWIERHLTPLVQQKILKKGIPGLHLRKDEKRVYPHGRLFSHVLGITSHNNQGVLGLEKGLEGVVTGSQKPLSLSLDVRLQHILRQELKKHLQLFSAKGANGILIQKNAHSWEVLAMVSLPDFNPNHLKTLHVEHLFNKNTMGVYEFGSLLKIHTVALALEEKSAHFHSVYDVSKPFAMGRFLIKDVARHQKPFLNLTEAFLASSNIATIHMAQASGGDAQHHFFEKLGFFKKLPTEMPEGALPLFPKKWTFLTNATASYGYGFSITPLHMIHSVATILDGNKKGLTFLHQRPHHKNPNAAPPEEILSTDTVQKMRFLLYQNVERGNGKKARIPGYAIGGKTGTANIIENGRYRERKNNTSFVSAFPIANPQYVLLVSLQQPKPNHLTHGYATAGWIAPPPFFYWYGQKTLKGVGLKGAASLG